MAANEFVQVRVTPPERERVDKITKGVSDRFPGLVTKAAVMRAALRIGLKALERHPNKVLEGGPEAAPSR